MANIKLTNSVKIVSDSLIHCINSSNVLVSTKFTQNTEYTWTASADAYFHIIANSWGTSYVKINNVDLSQVGSNVDVCGVIRKGDVIKAKQDAGDGGNFIKIFGLK